MVVVDTVVVDVSVCPDKVDLVTIVLLSSPDGSSIGRKVTTQAVLLPTTDSAPCHPEVLENY